MMLSWLRAYLFSASRSAKRNGGGRRARPYRFKLESLEDRLVLNSSPTPVGLLPAQLLHAYGIDQIRFNGGTVAGDGSGQTIAIIVGGDNPNIATDLHGFDQQFGLSDPTLTRVAADGSTTYPPIISAWVNESLLDVEWAHAVAPKANILLVEADTSQDATSFTNLMNAVDYARTQPAVSVISMSFGKAQFASEVNYDSHFTTPAGHIGITFLAATGDRSSPAGYPAQSPNVVAVGGTVLNVDTAGNYLSETGWNLSGGGLSPYEGQRGYQNGVITQSSTLRATPDVAMDAGTAVSVYDIRYGAGAPWGLDDGTSLATPLWAGLMAIADQGRALAGQGTLDGATQTLPALYQLPATDFHDITSGDNHYLAGPGYDLVTGRGSPVANLLVPDLVNYVAGTPPPPPPPPTQGPNAPVLTYTSANASSTTILGTMTGQPSTNYVLQFSADSSQGTSPLTQVQVTTDITGNATIYVYVHSPIPGQSITATATDPKGNVSQVSVSIQVVQSPNGSANEAFVAQVYLDLLHRPADLNGLVGWENFLNQGGTRAQLVQNFITSSEYETHQIGQMYLTLLHRPADAAGLANWVAYLQAGHSSAQVETSILGSEEYYQLHGNTDLGFLRGVFHDMLDRTVDGLGQATFLGQLATGMAPGAVAAAILTSLEADQDLVSADYQKFLHRTADSSGLLSWAEALQQGLAAEQLVINLVGSDEYFAAV